MVCNVSATLIIVDFVRERERERERDRESLKNDEKQFCS